MEYKPHPCCAQVMPAIAAAPSQPVTNDPTAADRSPSPWRGRCGEGSLHGLRFRNCGYWDGRPGLHGVGVNGWPYARRATQAAVSGDLADADRRCTQHGADIAAGDGDTNKEALHLFDAGLLRNEVELLLRLDPLHHNRHAEISAQARNTTQQVERPVARAHSVQERSVDLHLVQ